MDNVIKAIQAINSSAVYKITGSDLDTCIIEWLNGTTPISKADIQTKMDELQAEYDSQDYARKRKAEYPSIEDLVVALYDTDDKAAIDAKRAEIKLKYPKPGA
jgi:hypothetical protein